jgi:hypothetical protein
MGGALAINRNFDLFFDIINLSMKNGVIQLNTHQIAKPHFQKEGLKIEKVLNIQIWQHTKETKKLRLPITNI